MFKQGREEHGDRFGVNYKSIINHGIHIVINVMFLRLFNEYKHNEFFEKKIQKKKASIL